MGWRWPGMMLFSLGVSTLLVPGDARSQEQPKVGSPFSVGSRIRLLAPAVVSGRIEGMVIQMDEKSVLVGINGAPINVPRQAITELKISLGQKRQWRKGMIIGGAISAVVVAAHSEPWFIVGFIAQGVAIGAGIGALSKTDRWEPVPLDRVRVSLAPTSGRGVQLSLSLAF